MTKDNKPEFIYIDEPYEEEMHAGYERMQLLAGIEHLKEVRYPIALRIVAFFGALFCIPLSFAVALITAFYGLVAVCGLFRFETLNTPFYKSLNLLKKLLVIFIGLTLVIFSPPLGFGLILLYFLLSGEDINKSIMKKFTSWNQPNN